MKRLFHFIVLTFVAGCAFTQPVCSFKASDTVGCAPMYIEFWDSSAHNINSCIWNFDDGGGPVNYPCRSNLVHTFVSPGIYHVQLITNDGINADTCYKRIVMKSSGCDGPVGIDEESLRLLELSPNPTTSHLFIQTTNFHPQTLSIFDMNGRKLSEEVFSSPVDVSSLSAGVYFVEVKSVLRQAQQPEAVRRRWVKM